LASGNVPGGGFRFDCTTYVALETHYGLVAAVAAGAPGANPELVDLQRALLEGQDVQVSCHERKSGREGSFTAHASLHRSCFADAA
jgi:hypothetical protein